MSAPLVASDINLLPFFPDFSFANEKVDGLIPACRVESWQSFAEVANDKSNAPVEQMIYRGHRRHDWQLESTLARQFNGGSIPPKISSELLSKFRMAMRGRGFDLTGKSDDEVWAFGQHFGLATSLLDWTESPYVALFFSMLKADLKEETENPTRAVFRLNRSLISEVLPDLFFEPTLGENARLVNQAGLFTVTPDGGDNLVSAIINVVVEELRVKPDDPNDLARYICKFHIPNVDRIACLDSLRRMNIHHANLFPDPTGASEYCNDWLTRAVSEEKRREDEQRLLAERERRATKASGDRDNVAMARGGRDDVLKILDLYRPDDVAEFDAAALAAKIEESYQDNQTVDWPKQTSASARIRSAFKRLLLAAGFSEQMREKASSELAHHYASHYEAKGDSA